MLTLSFTGGVWGQESTCSSKAATCQEYVQYNPSAYEGAYWTINSLKVYTSDGNKQAEAPAANVPVSQPAPVAQPITTEPTTSGNTPTQEVKPKTPSNVIQQSKDGALHWKNGKREIDTPFNSVVEQPAVTERSVVDSGEEMYVKKGSVMRHLRRHQMSGFGHHHHS